MGKVSKDMCSFSYWRAREANSELMQEGYMYGKRQKDMCPFSYWRAREANSECTGVDKEKKKRVICSKFQRLNLRPHLNLL